MKVCHVSQTPVAGAAWAMSESFKEAGYDSFCCAGSRYTSGRTMPRDEDWPPGTREIEMILACDVLFCHQGKPYRMPWWPKDKATVGIYHSQPSARHTDRRLENAGWPAAAIGQWEERLYKPSVPAVPNLVPLEHPWFQVGKKPMDHIVIAYSPSNRTLTGWDDKGFDETAHVLSNVHHDLTHEVEVDIIEGVPLEDCLARKARAHIVIDEVVTGAYHRSSLESLALGCVVINNADGICWSLIRKMTGGCDHPFYLADISSLRNRLRGLIEMGPDNLKRRGLTGRRWMEGAWGSAELIERNFAGLMHEALTNEKELRQ